MSHAELAQLLTTRTGLSSVPEFSAILSRAVLPAPGIPQIVQQKAAIDQAAGLEFQSGKASSVELSRRLTAAYEQLVVTMAEQNGLADAIRNQGGALVSFGGFARGNVGVRSDWDMMLLNERGAPDLSHPSLTEFSDLIIHRIEAKFLIRESGMLATMLEDPRGQGIVSLTALMRMKVLIGDPANMDSLASSRDRLLDNAYLSVVQLLDRSIREREQKSGTLFRLAEFDLKEARGGLRDRDCIRWLDEISLQVHGRSLLTDQDRRLLANADEILLTAKHALHFSADGGKANQYTMFSNGRRDRVLEVFGRAASDLMPPRMVYDLIYSTAWQVHGLLQRVLQESFALSSDPVGATSAVLSPQPQLLLPRTREELGGRLKKGDEGLAPVIRGLHENGTLGQIVPEFDYARFFVDRAGFHRFPLGEHQVRAVEELSRLLFEVRQGRFALPEVKAPADTAPLFLATLLHDIAKPDEGDARDHHVRGAQIVHQVALGLGFSDAQAMRTRQLVEDHMLIANLSGHSESTLSVEAQGLQVSDLDYLQELLLLTLADKRESNPQAWRPAREHRILNAYEMLKPDMVDAGRRADIFNIKVQCSLAQRGVVFEPEQVREIIGHVNPRMLAAYSTGILAEKVRMLLDLRQNPQEMAREDLFRAELIVPEREDAPFALYILCRDSLGLLGRVSSFLSQRSMALKSALVDTHDGIVCDYLTIESLFGLVRFYDDDRQRFLNGLRNAVLGLSVPRSYSGSGASRGASFGDPVQVTVREDIQNQSMSLIIQDAARRDIFPLIAPILERQGLDIINAQIGCGNREIRHRIDLRTTSSSVPVDPETLKASIAAALQG